MCTTKKRFRLAVQERKKKISALKHERKVCRSVASRGVAGPRRGERLELLALKQRKATRENRREPKSLLGRHSHRGDEAGRAREALRLKSLGCGKRDTRPLIFSSAIDHRDLRKRGKGKAWKVEERTVVGGGRVIREIGLAVPEACGAIRERRHSLRERGFRL